MVRLLMGMAALLKRFSYLRLPTKWRGLIPPLIFLIVSACGIKYEDIRATSISMRAEASGVPFIPTATSRLEATFTVTSLGPTTTKTWLPSETVTYTPPPTATPTATFTPPPTLTQTPHITEELPTTVGEVEDWWQVYFTDPGNISASTNLAGKLIELINAASNTIHIASFEFDLDSVATALISAQQRGVEILWVTDDVHGLEADGDEGHGQFALMRQAGIEVRDDARSGLMHNKFWIFDEQIVWTGSTNITANGTLLNNNNVIILANTSVAEIYEREFMEMWAGSFGITSESTIGQQMLIIDSTPIQILFGAEDDIATYLTALLNSASNQIRFMAFSFTHDDMGAAMRNRAAAGVDVAGIIELRGSQTSYSELPALFCASIPVRQDGNPRTFHHKVIIIDNNIVITGSFNFSDNANSTNDENVVIITHTDIAALFLQEFDDRWLESSPPDPVDFNCE